MWGPDNILFVSSAYGGGSRALELHQSGGKTTVRELWANPRLQLHFGSAVRSGNYVYLSDAYNGPALMTAVDVRTGKAAWQRRGYAKAQLLLADGKLILLDEDGALALAIATFKVLTTRRRKPGAANLTPPRLGGKECVPKARRRSRCSSNAMSMTCWCRATT